MTCTHTDTPGAQLEELSGIRGFCKHGLSGVCVCMCARSRVLHILGNNIPANDRFSGGGVAGQNSCPLMSWESEIADERETLHRQTDFSLRQHRHDQLSESINQCCYISLELF